MQTFFQTLCVLKSLIQTLSVINSYLEHWDTLVLWQQDIGTKGLSGISVLRIDTNISHIHGHMKPWHNGHCSHFVYIYGTLQYQATFFVDIFLFSGSVWWLSIFMGIEFLQNSKSMNLFIQCLPQKIQVSAFRHNLGCARAPFAQNWVYFRN